MNIMHDNVYVFLTDYIAHKQDRSPCSKKKDIETNKIVLLYINIDEKSSREKCLKM